MAEQRTSRIQILFNLENETRQKNGMPLLKNLEELLSVPPDNLVWEEIPNIFSIRQAKIDENTKIADAGSAIAIKVFVNKKTVEVRQFISKFTDEPETNILPD